MKYNKLINFSMKDVIFSQSRKSNSFESTQIFLII